MSTTTTQGTTKTRKAVQTERKNTERTTVQVVPLHVAQQTEVVRALERIAEANQGYISPDSVVEAARAPSSALHGYFLWDDTEAARRFRLVQAGMLLRRIRVHVVRPGLPDEAGAVQRVRAYQSDPGARGTVDGSYAPVQTLLSDPDRRTALIASVLGELRAMRRRYEDLSELAGVWTAIDALDA